MFDRAGASRILKGTSADLELQVYVAGVATAPDSGTVTVTDEAGNTVVDAQNVSVAGTKATYTLTPAETENVNFLTAVWTLVVGGVGGQVFTTQAKVVGELLFTLGDARAFDEGALASTSKYTDDEILWARDAVTDSFEEALGRLVGANYRREVLDGDGTAELELPGVDVRSVRSIRVRAHGTQTWTAFTADELADVTVDEAGLIVRESLGVFTSGRKNIAVEWEAGMRIPGELRQAGLMLAKELLVKSNLSDRAVQQVNDLGTVNLAVAGRGSSRYGIPFIDAAIHAYSRKLPGIA